MTILVVASRNAGKIAEIRRLLDDVGLEIELKSVAEFDLPDVEETGDSFEANALLKARTIAVATGYPAIADDSGLAVDALDGAPGIFSARWSGSHGNDRANIAKLLDDLRDVPVGNRNGRFIAAISLVLPNGEEITARGELPGTIRFEAIGENGFGYDPIFQPEGETRTLAQMAPAEKDAISHRARALRDLAPKIGPFIHG
ncbi:MAG: hypothetical protein RJB30_610 [Actinomycetota bacterium]